MLGFAGPAADGRDDDLHERSRFGSFHGGALAPVAGADGLGLPVFLAPTLTLDAESGPGIDRGAAGDPFGAEPEDNGGYINIGAYGNTLQASKSPATYVTVIGPNGGEVLAQESSARIGWRADGVSGNVAIDISRDDGASWNVLAADEPDDGSYTWNIDPATDPTGSLYRVRVRFLSLPAVTDTSDAAFTVSPPISVYYVNDAGQDGDQYTSAPGNDANDGLTPGTPMASIRAVIERYDLDAGDVIRVDTGNYALSTNIVITAADSGVAIEGPTAAGARAVIDRGNTASSSFTFQLAGADDVTLRNLVIRGANIGVQAANGAGSDRLRVEASELTGNLTAAASIGTGNAGAVFAGNLVWGLGGGGTGIRIDGSGARVIGNEVWGFGTGIDADTGSPGQVANEVLDNVVYENGTGIEARRAALVQGNRVYGNSSSGISGIDTDVLIVGNEVYRNPTGINLGLGAVARDNRVYASTLTGIDADGSTSLGAVVDGNRVYDNLVGITERSSRVVNNLVYDNATGIQTGGLHTVAGTGLTNNTVAQASGNAIVLTASARDTRLRNNILEVTGGSAIVVPSRAQAGFASDYNLFHLGAGGRIGFWEDRDFTTLADWSSETGADAESLVADPRFVETGGADGFRGFDSADDGGSLIADDGDAGFSTIGAWSALIGRADEAGSPPYVATQTEKIVLERAFGADVNVVAGGVAGTVARWSFDGLADGTYEVATRWVNGLNLPLGQGRYRFYDGAPETANVVALANLIQTAGTPPNDFTADGFAWERLETVEIRSGRLVVELSTTGISAADRLMADAVRIQRLGGDHGADDNFRLGAGSAAIDRGDPTTSLAREPVNNGGRVDLGAYGNTALAAQSPARQIQIVDPNGGEKLEAGQSTTIRFVSSGLTRFDPVLLINMGGTGARLRAGQLAAVAADTRCRRPDGRREPGRFGHRPVGTGYRTGSGLSRSAPIIGRGRHRPRLALRCTRRRLHPAPALRRRPGVRPRPAPVLGAGAGAGRGRDRHLAGGRQQGRHGFRARLRRAGERR